LATAGANGENLNGLERVFYGFGLWQVIMFEDLLSHFRWQNLTDKVPESSKLYMGAQVDTVATFLQENVFLLPLSIYFFSSRF
jgi:hypothetical protein